MSSSSTPIGPAAFALALQDLPLSNLHAKAAELQNSISHLYESNIQLVPFAEDDPDCAGAIGENEEVVKRMEERIHLLRAEVERRGFRWGEAEVEDKAPQDGETVGQDGTAGPNSAARAAGGPRANGSNQQAASQAGGGPNLSDDELRRRLMERMDTEDDDEGVHL